MEYIVHIISAAKRLYTALLTLSGKKDYIWGLGLLHPSNDLVCQIIYKGYDALHYLDDIGIFSSTVQFEILFLVIYCRLFILIGGTG